MQAKQAYTEPSKSLTPKQGDNKEVDADAARAEFVLRLHQAIRNVKRRWRICDQRVCKRAKKCCASQAFCAKYDRQRPVKPEQVARAKALLYRALKAEADRRDALEEAAEKAAAPAAKIHKKS